MVVLGSEGRGVADALHRMADISVEIKCEAKRQEHTIDSLNVGVAAGLVVRRVWEVMNE